MKQLKLEIAILLFALAPFMVTAQNSPVNKLFDKYSDVDGMTSVDITKGLFELFAEIDTDDEEFEDFKKAIEGLESLRLLACSLGDSATSNKVLKEEFFSDIMKSVPFNEYKELIIIRDKDEVVKFYAKNNKQVITEMLMVVDSNEEAVLLSLQGELDLNYVSKLGSAMKMGGMEHLGKMHHD